MHHRIIVFVYALATQDEEDLDEDDDEVVGNDEIDFDEDDSAEQEWQKSDRDYAYDELLAR